MQRCHRESQRWMLQRRARDYFLQVSICPQSVPGLAVPEILCFYNLTVLSGILKSRDITLPTKVCLIKAMVFPVVMCECESWTIKKVEHLRIDAFELWCWRRLLRVPWTARRSNQSIVKEISLGMMLKLKQEPM